MRHFVVFSISLLLLVSIIIAMLHVCVFLSREGAFVSASNNNDDDDDILDVSDEVFDSDRDRRSRFNFGDGEKTMEYEDFSDFTRQQKDKDSSSSSSKKDNKKEESSSKNHKKQQEQQQSNNNNKQNSNSRKEEYQKKKDEYYKDKKDRESSSSKSSSSKSSSPPKTLTDKVAYLTKTLEDIKSDFSARQNHLLRVSTPADITSPRHFNSSLNAPSALKALSQLVSTFGIQNIVDGDVLTRANSALSTARLDARSYRSKIEAAEKQHKKSSSSKDPQAPTGDSLPSTDHKLIALQKNIKIVDALVDELVAEEIRQRVTHKRLLRAAKLTSPTVRKFFSDVINAADIRLAEMRGARSGEIDNAAPSSGNAREERLARKRFTQTVKVIKQALNSYMLFEKIVSQRSRSGTGLTKSMEPLFVLTQIIARDSFQEDCIELLAAADEQNSHSDSDKSFTELGTFILEQYKTHHEKALDTETKKEDKELAKTVFEIHPTTTTGVTFGLEVGEVLGLVLCLVVPIQLFQILFVIVCKIISAKFGPKDNNDATRMKNARVKKYQQQQKDGNTRQNNNKSSKNQGPQASFVILMFLLVIQLVLPFLLTDLPPMISSRIEDLPLHLKNSDITLPSILFSVLRLQTSDASVARLGCACFLLALFQALSVARSIAVHSAALVGSNSSNEDEE